MAEYPIKEKKIKNPYDYYPYTDEQHPSRIASSTQTYPDIKKPLKPLKISTFEEDVNDIAFELVQLLIKKHKDYGPKNINNSPYGAIQGLVVRMWDKIARIVNLTRNGRHAENEPLEDSFMDLANYAIIGLMVQRGKWPNE